MAILYVRSTDGNNSDDGSTWALAKATLAGAFAAASAGDTIYVSNNHAETQASAMTLTPPGSVTAPVWVICVNDSAEPPTALATTATVATTGSNAIAFTPTGAGGAFAYFYGITFRGATSGTQGCITIATASTTGYAYIFKDCSLGSGAGPTSSNFITVGSNQATSDDQLVILDNVTIHTVHANQQLVFRNGRIIWQNTTSALTGATLPTTLIHTETQSQSNQILIRGIDFSALGSGKNLVQIGRASCARIQFVNCKLGASVTLTTGTHSGPGAIVLEMVNCDSSDTNYMYYYQDYAGLIQQETTIVRTGGATDGTTSMSREMVSSSNAKFFYPLILKDLSIWNETTGSSITLTVHIITDNVTLTDKECWLEVEYLGTSGFPLSLISNDSDTITDLLLGGSASNQTTSTETWTTTGLTTPVKQQLSVSITPQEKGPIRCRVVLAKASTTVYVCPKIEIS